MKINWKDVFGMSFCFIMGTLVFFFVGGTFSPFYNEILEKIFYCGGLITFVIICITTILSNKKPSHKNTKAKVYK